MHPIVGLVTSFLALTIPLVLLARISFLGKGERKDSHSLSVIIPARNEEKRIVPLLESLRSQSVRPSEVCVVDDSSTDQTAEIVKKHGYRVVQCPILPEGWTGKSWACWNGVHSTEGELLLFLDADVTLKKDALERLLFEYERTGGLISVQPFHLMSRFHEYFSAFFNMIVMMSMRSFSFFGKWIQPLGAFGPVILCSRKDYLIVGGHERIRTSILEDVELGQAFIAQRIPVTPKGGRGSISFRMYPEGFRTLTEGWGKNFASGASKTDLVTLVSMIVIITGWISILIGFAQLPVQPFHWAHIYYPVAYICAVFELRWLWSKIGSFGYVSAILFPVHLLFFVGIFFVSMFFTMKKKRVHWKGRTVIIHKDDQE